MKTQLSEEAKTVVQAWFPKIFTQYLYICKFCSCPCKGSYCQDCRTAKQRKEMSEIAAKEGYIYKPLNAGKEEIKIVPINEN